MNVTDISVVRVRPSAGNVSTCLSQYVEKTHLLVPGFPFSSSQYSTAPPAAAAQSSLEALTYLGSVRPQSHRSSLSSFASLMCVEEILNASGAENSAAQNSKAVEAGGWGRKVGGKEPGEWFGCEQSRACVAGGRCHSLSDPSLAQVFRS